MLSFDSLFPPFSLPVIFLFDALTGKALSDGKPLTHKVGNYSFGYLLEVFHPFHRNCVDDPENRTNATTGLWYPEFQIFFISFFLYFWYLCSI